MNILLTTHQMAAYEGSEIYTFELAKGLKQAGHTVVVYSRYIDIFEYPFARMGIELVTDLKNLTDRSFDVAHVHHNINALEVRHHFPKLPIFFLSHGAATFLETPPGVDINITQYGAISERVAASLVKSGVKRENILLVNNIVNDTLFTSDTPINKSPKKALIISNRMDQATAEKIKKACDKMKIEVTAVGKVFQKADNTDIPKLINKVDIVFTIGRGVIETMFCGRIPFVFDLKGGDGILTTRKFYNSAKHHFSGKNKNIQFTVSGIVKELKKYDQTQGEKLKLLAHSQYSTAQCVEKLEKIYATTIKNYSYKKINSKLLQYVVEAVAVTRLHTFSRSEKRGRVDKLKYFVKDFPVMAKERWVALSIPSISSIFGIRSFLQTR